MGPQTPYVGHDIRLLSALHRNQARIYKRAQAALMRRIADESVEPGWRMPESIREELSVINTFLNRATRAMLHVHEAAAMITAKAGTEELAAQLKHELVLAAKTFTPDEWALLDRVRAEQGLAA